MAVAQRKPPVTSSGVVGWLRTNLFSSVGNSILSVIFGALLIWALLSLLRWTFFAADWERIWVNLKLFSVYRYPTGSLWRPMAVLGLTMGLFGITAGAASRGESKILPSAFRWIAALVFGLTIVGLIYWESVRFLWLGVSVITVLTYLWGRAQPQLIRYMALAWGLGLFVGFYLLYGVTPIDRLGFVGILMGLLGMTLGAISQGASKARIPASIFLWLLTALEILVVFWAIFSWGPLSSSWLGIITVTLLGYFWGRLQPSLLRFIPYAWGIGILVGLYLLYGVSTTGPLRVIPVREWGGFLLSLILATALIPSFPLGILLALGRRSSLPAIKYFCIGFIEIVRGAPLIMWLFIASLLLPLILNVDSSFLPALLRAYVAIMLFSAAYMAENVRGGLQAVASGQGEAARALGLSSWQTTRMIVLPQALRAVIPAIVGQAIGLFKDTSLVFVVGLFDLFNVQNVVANQPASLQVPGGIRLELSLFIALIYWFFAYRMSVASRQLEAELGVGTR